MHLKAHLGLATEIVILAELTSPSLRRSCERLRTYFVDQEEPASSSEWSNGKQGIVKCEASRYGLLNLTVKSGYRICGLWGKVKQGKEVEGQSPSRSLRSE
jgi:hypothetical protein